MNKFGTIAIERITNNSMKFGWINMISFISVSLYVHFTSSQKLFVQLQIENVQAGIITNDLNIFQ